MRAHQSLIREKEGKDPIHDMFGAVLPDTVDLVSAKLRQIDFLKAKPIIERYEWIGTMPLPKSCRYIYGLYFDNILGGVCIYVHPSTRQFEKNHPRQVVQLNRGACLPWTPKNTASRLIGLSIKMLRQAGVRLIIAYCTKEAGEFGTIYQSCNFIYTGETAPSKVYFLDGHWISERTLADKTLWAKRKLVDEWTKIFKNLPSKTLQGKYRYILPIGSKKQNKEIIELYKYQSLPYPKRTVKNEASG